MQFVLSTLGPHIDGIMDITIYRNQPERGSRNNFWHQFSIFQSVVPPVIQMHVKFHPIAEISYKDPQAFSQWMYEIFQAKDRLMAEFYKTGRFKGSRSSPIPVAPSSAIFWITVATFISTFILWTAIGELFAWFKFR